MSLSQDPKRRKLIMIFIFLPVLIFILIRMFVITPQLFSFFAMVIVLTFVIYFITKIIHHFTAEKCASCGGPLRNMGVAKVVNGMLNKDGGPDFDPIGKQIFSCVDCEKEYHELVYYSSIKGEAVDYKSKTEVELSFAKIMMQKKGDLSSINNKDFSHRSITATEYKALKKDLAAEVRAHNTRNGYLKNPIKIDIDDSNK